MFKLIGAAAVKKGSQREGVPPAPARKSRKLEVIIASIAAAIGIGFIAWVLWAAFH